MSATVFAALHRSRLAGVASRAWLPLLLALAPLLVFHPIVFSHYTLSRAAPAIASGPQYGDSETIPMLDPGAAASQDESWLVLVRRLMAAGELPVINMHNGLGAPLLESLQPGAFYLLNPLLLLLDPRSPTLFDAFSLLHASVFLVGLFVLARLYARPSIACVSALAVGLTGVTYQHLDMVHYRSLVWLPLALCAAIRFARGSAGRGSFVLFVFAHVAALTAGALQEVFISSVVIGLVFVFELVSAPATRRERLARLVPMSLAAASSSLIGLVSIVPYLVARKLGDIFTAAGSTRAAEGLAPDGLPTLLVPHVNGFWPYMVREKLGMWITDFSASGCLFVLVALTCACLPRGPDGFPRRVTACIGVLCALALLKLQRAPWFDFVQSIPYLSEIRFVKYHYSLFVLFAILSAIGLEALARMDARRRRRVVLTSSGVLALLLLPIAWLYLSSRWTFPVHAPEPVLAEARWSYFGTGTALLASIALLLAMPRGAFAWLALVMLALGICVRPNGWMQRSPVYRTSIEATLSQPVRELRPAPTTDANWERGIARGDAAGFFVLQPASLSGLEVGTTLRFARSGERRVQRKAGNRVWVDGAALDPEEDGAPHVVAVVDPKPVEPQRWASLLAPNQNAISGYESVWVFDPISNFRLRELLAERFKLANPWFDLQAIYRPRKGLSAEEVDWLRFLGVTRIRDYNVESQDGLQRIGPQLIQVEGELPRVFLLDRGVADEITGRFQARPIATSLADLHAEIAAQPAVTDLAVGARDLVFGVERDFEGCLVVTQAFSHGWTFQGAQPEVFCRLYPSWQVRLEAGRTHRVAFRPPGLSLALAVGAGGLVLATLSFVFLGRVQRRSA